MKASGGGHRAEPSTIKNVNNDRGKKGVAVGCLVCPKRHLKRLRDVLEQYKWLKNPATATITPYDGAGAVGCSAIHLNPDGCTALSSQNEADPDGEASGGEDVPAELTALLAGGEVRWEAEVRLGSRCCLGRDLDFQLHKAEKEWKRKHQPAGKAPNRKAVDGGSFRFIELFAGIGGFRLGLTPLGGECVFSSELTREARDTYAANFGERPSGDITEIETADIPSHDFLTAGFPCQSFSRTGRQDGFRNFRGSLFFEVTRVLHAHQPKGFLLENVTNLLKVDGGAAVALIDAELEACGYKVERFVLNSSDYGCPQLRERLFFLGVRRDLAPQATTEATLLSGIKPSHRDGRKGDRQVSDWGMGHPPVDPCLPPRTLLRNFLEEDSNLTEACALSEHQWANIMRGAEYRKDPEYRYARTEGQARTLTSCYKTGYLWHSEFVRRKAGTPRFFTHRECARLMGFPEDFRIDANVDPNRFYHQIGNAVCPPVVQAIVARFLQVYPLVYPPQATDAAATPGPAGDPGVSRGPKAPRRE